MILTRLAGLSLPALLVVAACGGSSDLRSQAYRALNSGRFSDAVRCFDRALEEVDETDNDYLGLVLGKCEALAAIDAERARELFLATAATHPLAVRDYSKIVRLLVWVQAFEPALDILEQGESALPAKLEFARLAAVVARVRTQQRGECYVHCCGVPGYL